MTPLARFLLARVEKRSSIPRYGSPEWDNLPDQDPRRAAGVIIAAECWRDHCEPAQIALDLLTEMEQQERELHRRIRGASADVHEFKDWKLASQSLTFAELQQRRAS